MGRRRLARETALQALYLADTARMGVPDAYRIVRAGARGLDERSEAFCRELLDGVESHREEIDGHLRAIAVNWELERMAAVDRNVLRLACFELLHCGDTPPGVAIDEALEIAKTYSGEDSSRFINGILDKVKERRDEPPKP